MFGRSHFSDFDQDPFFSMHHDQMHNRDEMFGNIFGADPMMAVTNGEDRQHRQRHRDDPHQRRDIERSRNTDVMPHGGHYDPFGFMNSMMSNMHSMMGNAFRQMESVQNDPNSHSYMQHTVMSYNNTGQGEPKVYQATTATRQAPGGIRETRKSVRDTEAGMEKMAVGRHMNDRGHVITRQKNMRTGDMDENNDYLNFDESEAPQFEDEWRQRTSQYGRHDNRSVDYEPHSQHHHRPVRDRRHPDDYDDPPRRSSNKMKAVEQGRHVERAY